MHAAYRTSVRMPMVVVYIQTHKHARVAGCNSVHEYDENATDIYVIVRLWLVYGGIYLVYGDKLIACINGSMVFFLADTVNSIRIIIKIQIIVHGIYLFKTPNHNNNKSTFKLLFK